MTIASAPGKVILFGEHAVVCGVSSVGAAIDLRVRVKISDYPGQTRVSSSGLDLSGFSLDLISGQITSEKAFFSMRYISAVLNEFDARNIHLTVDSDLPPASGLGSSAAVTVASVCALSKHCGQLLEPKEIAAISHKIERRVQQGMASPTDTALATFGGYLHVSKEVEILDLPTLDIVVGYTKTSHDTKYQVSRVQSLRERHPDIVNPIFQAIGVISGKAIQAIRDQRLLELGELMNVNHGLLEAIGVGTRELSELVYAARGAGSALGAKITGAGGGGCMIALPSGNGSCRLTTSIEQAKGAAFPVKLGCEGVRLEVEP